MAERYARQELFAGIGPDGQARIRASRVAVVGCGALGTHSANALARAGVGTLVLIDRDFVEVGNLQRQVLFDDADAQSALPKAIAAAVKLRAANPDCEVRPIVVDLSANNAELLLANVDLVIDGTDTFDTRYLVHEVCVKRGIPWVYGGVVGSHGMVYPFVPERGPCFACAFPDPPPPGLTPTCDTAGILEPVVAVIAGLQCGEALKLLVGARDALRTKLLSIDLWTCKTLEVSLGQRDPACPACGTKQFPNLSAHCGVRATTLCGRNAVQVTPAAPGSVDLVALSNRLARVGQVVSNPYLLRVQVDGCELTLFQDGRAIIHGTGDEAVARSLYARYIGA